MTEEQLNKELERLELKIETQRHGSIKCREEVVTCNSSKSSISRELFKCKGDLELNTQYYEQTLEAIKNAPHGCKGEWGWASDNIFCPIENEWQSSSMEVKYAVIAGVSVLAIATLGLAGYGVYAYFNPNVIEVAAAPEAMKLYFTASNELKIQIALGFKHHKASINMGDLNHISDYLISDPAQALDFFQQLPNTKQEYIGQIAPHVSEFFHNPNLVGEVNLYLSDLLNNPA